MPAEYPPEWAGPAHPKRGRSRAMVIIMCREEVIAGIRKHADAIRAEGATALYLFGSAARDQLGATSDIDMFVEYNPESRFSLINMSGIRLIVMDELGREVDITTRDSLHPRLRNRILAEAIRVL